MKKRQIGGWNEPQELKACKPGTEVVLIFDNKERYQGVIKVVDEEDNILLQSSSSDQVIGLPLARLVYWCQVAESKPLTCMVYPSDVPTIEVEDDPEYGGAHRYYMRESRGFVDGKTIYTDEEQEISFVRKRDDGVVEPGLQSEQLAYVLLDQCEKLNARFPSPQNEKMIAGLRMFIDACRERVEDRMSRGVMGALKK